MEVDVTACGRSCALSPSSFEFALTVTVSVVFVQLEKFFAAQLSAIIGDYVDGVTPESLDLRIGLRSGSVELVNLRIKQGVRGERPCDCTASVRCRFP